jgi:hypothetical protein
MAAVVTVSFLDSLDAVSSSNSSIWTVDEINQAGGGGAVAGGGGW